MAGETLNCSGVENSQGLNKAIVDQGVQEVQTTERDGRVLVFCPAFEQGTCVRAKLLSPDDHKFSIAPLCMLDSTGRMLYPELRAMAATVEPDSDALSRITMVKSRDQIAEPQVVIVSKPEASGSFPLLTTVIEKHPQPDTISVLNVEPIEPETAKELAGIPQLEKEVDFMPFAGARGFFVTEDDIAQACADQAEGDDIPVLLSQAINYSGIKGIIEIISDIPDDFDDVVSYFDDKAKPLGAVRWTAESNNGELSYVALPVRLRLSFSTKRFTQYMILQQSLLELSFADGSKYYLSCSKDPDDEEYNREDFKDLGRGEKKIFTAEETTDEDGSEESITLPMDLAMLKSLTMRFVDNPDFEEDPDEDNS
jgi:hypothetical protein